MAECCRMHHSNMEPNSCAVWPHLVAPGRGVVQLQGSTQLPVWGGVPAVIIVCLRCAATDGMHGGRRAVCGVIRVEGPGGVLCHAVWRAQNEGLARHIACQLCRRFVSSLGPFSNIFLMMCVSRSGRGLRVLVQGNHNICTCQAGGMACSCYC
jgi:hypothetical protein